MQTVAFGSMTTGVAEDLSRGLVDRFRSLPKARSAVRTVAGFVRNMFVVVMLIVGFRPEGGVVGWTAAIGLLLVLSFAFSWVVATIGLMMRSVESLRPASSGCFR